MLMFEYKCALGLSILGKRKQDDAICVMSSQTFSNFFFSSFVKKIHKEKKEIVCPILFQVGKCGTIKVGLYKEI